MLAGRNDPCPCGSGKKYKKCCLREQATFDGRVMEIRRAQDEVERAIVHYALDMYGGDCTEEAWEEFAEDAHHVEFEGPEMQVFWPWFYYDWQPEHVDDATPESTTNLPGLAEEFLEERGRRLPDPQRQFVQAVIETPWSFHDVLEVEPGRSNSRGAQRRSRRSRARGRHRASMKTTRAAASPMPGRVASRKPRKPVSPKVRAMRVQQGRYLAALRNLRVQQRVQVKRAKADGDYGSALKLAASLRKKSA